jgi:hypothetical protein
MNCSEFELFALADRIRNCLLAQHRGQHPGVMRDLDFMAQKTARFSKIISLLSKCSQKGLYGAAKKLREEAIQVLRDISYERNAAESLLNPESDQILSVREIVNELRQLTRDLGEWHFDKDEEVLSVSAGEKFPSFGRFEIPQR